MNLTFPHDLELLNGFRPLLKELGLVQAVFLVHKLWQELFFQCRAHGKPGLFTHDEREYFEWTIRDAAIAEPIALLLRSGLLQPQGEDWVSPLFESLHRDMDPARMDARKSSNKVFNRTIKMHADAATGLLTSIAPDCWKRADGTTAPQEQVRRALTLIRFLDATCGLPSSRKPDGFTPGLVQRAVEVCERYDDTKLVAIERRIYGYQRQHGMEAYREAEHLLANFDSLVFKIYPAEGFVSTANENQD